MNPIKLADIATWVGGTLLGPADLNIHGFALDSRNPESGSLFLAIKGERVDGHDFAEKAIMNGACAVLCERHLPAHVPQILVPDLVAALASMAGHFRSEFHGPVVGITGSVGKTTTKEFIAACLSPLGQVVTPEGNRNTEYTAPLLWAEVNPTTKAVVVEMGMRGSGQIRHLASFSRPNIALITSIGHSHANMVGGRQGIAEAKAELFETLSAGDIAITAEVEFLSFLKTRSSAPVLTYGLSGDNLESEVIEYQLDRDLTATVTWRVGAEKVTGKILAPGKHLAENAAGALLVAREAGVSLTQAADAIQATNLPKGRMERVTKGGITWILDLYNAAPDSTKAALNTVQQLATDGTPVFLVLGEMRELGEYTQASHEEIGAMVAKIEPQILMVLDAPNSALRPTRWIVEKAIEGGLESNRVLSASSHEEIRAKLAQIQEKEAIVLVKGSRAVELEKALPEDVQS